MPPEDEGPIGPSSPQHPRFQWTPPDDKSAPAPPSAPKASTRKVSASGQPAPAATAQEPQTSDDITGSLSINQILGGSRFATKDDLWAASDRMRAKLGPAGAAKWAADYGKAEFEAMAQKVVDTLLEGAAEDEVKRVEKDTKKVAKKANQTITRWFHSLYSKKAK